MSKSSAKISAAGNGGASSGAKSRGNAAFNAPLKPTPELAAVVGEDPLPRTEAVSRMWDYIKKHKLLDEKNRREIIADEKLKPIFGKDRATMFEMSAFLARNLKRA